MAPEVEVDADLDASWLLALARDRKATEDRAAAELLEIAARWADLHPPESIHSAAAFTVPGSDHEEPLAGDGCPLVAEFCIAELGAVLGVSTTSAKKLIGHALELRHRLPRLWAQMQSGAVPAWRARTVAETTIHTTPVPHRRGCCLRRRAGRGRRRQDRSRPARPSRCGDHQALRPRSRRPGRGPGGRLPVGRPAPRDVARRGRPLRRHDAVRGRPRHRRRPRPQPRPDPEGRRAEGPRLDRVPRRATCQGPRRPRPHPDRTRSAGAEQPRIATASPPPARSSSTPTSTPRPSASRPCSVRPAGWRRASGPRCWAR